MPENWKITSETIYIERSKEQKNQYRKISSVMYRRNSSSIEKKKKTVLREKLVNKGIEIKTISQIPVEGIYNKWKSKGRKSHNFSETCKRRF